MDEPIFSEFPAEFSETFLTFCTAPTPGPEFVADLEQRLLERQHSLASSARPEPSRKAWKPFSAWFPAHRWQFAVLVLLVALSAALLVIGPQRVLAQIQLWFGYLPGAGFINPAQTRILAAPVDARQEETTLQVQQVIASADKTVVVATLNSLPSLITLETQWASQVSLVLPNGLHFSSQTSSQRTQAGQLWAEIEYPPLPEGILQVFLEMPKLPIDIHATQQTWSVSLPLQAVGQPPANGNPLSTAVSTAPGSLAVLPYTPPNAQVTHQGVTVRLLQVGQSLQETGLLLEIDWSDPGWDYLGSSVELRDARGHVYPQLEPAPGSRPANTGGPQGKTTAQEMLRFAPLDPGAQQVTLTLDSIDFQVQSQATFQFDPGALPHLGQTWSYTNDPTKQLEMAGFQVQILQADLVPAPAGDQVTVVNPPEATEIPQPSPLPVYACRLQFMVQVTPQPDTQFFIGTPQISGGSQGLAGASSEGDLNRATIFLDLAEIPTSPLTIQLNDSSLFLKSGWQITWLSNNP